MAAINPFRYAGYRYDEATGLYYLMARYYDPGVGRFITRDTFHGFDAEPQSLHQYVYCENNPVMRIDPSGHAWDYTKPWNHVNNIGFIIDGFLIVAGPTLGIIGYQGKVRQILGKNAKVVLLQSTRKLLLKAKLEVVTSSISLITGALDYLLDFSLGIALAKAWDRYDMKKYNNICDKMYEFAKKK